MFMNFMDYVDDAAMTMFTRDQAARIAATLAGPRASLQRSRGLLDPDQPPAESAAASKARSATSSA
jgi:hypothetical protein